MASGAHVPTLDTVFGIVGLNPDLTMSSKMLCPVAHRRTIAAGVIRGPSIAADGIDHDADLVAQILAPGRGIARTRCHLREHARGGQGEIISSTRRQSEGSTSASSATSADISGLLRVEALPPVGRMPRLGKRGRQALTTFSASTVIPHDHGQGIRQGGGEGLQRTNF